MWFEIFPSTWHSLPRLPSFHVARSKLVFLSPTDVDVQTNETCDGQTIRRLSVSFHPNRRLPTTDKRMEESDVQTSLNSSTNSHRENVPRGPFDLHLFSLTPLSLQNFDTPGLTGFTYDRVLNFLVLTLSY